MSLLRDETPRLPSTPSPHRGATRLAFCFAMSAVPSSVRGGKLVVSFLDNPGRTYPLGAYGSSPGALAMAPHPVASKAMPMLLEMADYTVLDFLATDLIFGVSEMAPPPRCARACC